MSRVFFIADLHLGHEKMAQKRGFKDAKEQDQHIINCWNKVVNKRDKVFILGDIVMEKTNSLHILKELNGSKDIILGNHDIGRVPAMLYYYVNKIYGAFKYKGFILTHIPIHEQEIQYWRGNIHGHLHEEKIEHPKYFGVSCEQLNYTPILFTEILKLINK